MTYLEATYRYREKLTPPVLRRLADLRGYYGIVGLRMDEEQQRLWVEYDASRLKETDVLYWLRLAGVPIVEKIELTPAA